MAKQKFESNMRVVVIGGGTGSFTILSELKHQFSSITSLVNMVDSGGSTGVLRDELGVLPPGDVRQCLVALSEAPEALRHLFTFRFPEGSLEGHSFGNIFLSAVERMSDSFDEAVLLASQVLQIKGVVLPLTVENCQLMLQYKGKKYKGEGIISDTYIAHDDVTLPIFWIEPSAQLTDAAHNAIINADMIVIAPGNLYCSLIPSLLVDGLKDAIDASSAPLLYVANLVNKPKQTKGFYIHDYVSELNRFLGKRKIEIVVYNTDTPSPILMRRYALDEEYPVGADVDRLKKMVPECIGAPLVEKGNVVQSENDTRIERSYIRHNAKAVANELRILADKIGTR